MKATDAAGNTDATPASYTWTIQNTPPTVTGTVPASGATGVAATIAPTATFSRAMDATTITTTSFTLKRPDLTVVPATVAYNSGTLTATLTPTAALAASTTYTASLATTIKASDGVALASAVTWTFTTAAAGGAPTVTSVTPPDGTTNVNRAYHPTATFSVDMNATTLTTTSFSIKNPVGAAVAGTVAYNSATKTATFTPTTTFAALTTFTAKLDVTIKSATGVPLAAVYTWRFQTSSPSVIGTYPSNAAYSFMSTSKSSATVPLSGAVAEISPWTPIEVTFSEPMNPATITTTSFSVVDSTGAAVPATITYDSASNTAIFDPTNFLDYGGTYTASVNTTILAALDGAPLQAPVTWQFIVTRTFLPVGINVGSPVPNFYVASSGALFRPDRPIYSAAGPGTVRTTTNPIAGTSDPALYQDERVGMTSYTIPVADGWYDIKLHFAETQFSAANQRVFTVDVGETAGTDLPNLDIFSLVGANTALVKTIPHVRSNTVLGPLGNIHLTFTSIIGQPVISAIELVPLPPEVTVVSPAKGATGVARSAPIKATFGQGMQGATFTTSTFTVTGPGGTPVAATVTYAILAKTATLTPSAALAPNTTYTVTLDATTIKSVTGLRLTTPTTWTFTTGSV